jgi:sulfoquinovose isomerase
MSVTMRLITPDDESWLTSATHRAWTTGQVLRLLEFFKASVDDRGRFVELDDDGRPLPTGCPPATRARQNLLTVTRAVHSYALGELLGIPGCAAIVEHGLCTLWEDHRDATAGGYITAVGHEGDDDTSKRAYGHAHVLLAASSATAAGHQAASALFDDVLAVIDRHFWSETDGASAETYDRDWRETESYRGANSNMHLCEALLAAAESRARPDLAQRAVRLVKRFVDDYARHNDWLLPEHYDLAWKPDVDYNHDRLDDPFRPFGATVGHSLEWARLAICTQLATGQRDDRLVEASEALFDRAVRQGWDERHGGLAYTLDWTGAPANSDHYWWPVAEGIGTAAYLLRVTGHGMYEDWYRRFWEYAATHLIDHARGGWYPQLDVQNRRKVHPWYGKPDIYHAIQACLLPTHPVASSTVGAIRSSRQVRT